MCEFRNCLVYFDSILKEPAFFESYLEGTIAEHLKGERKKEQWSEFWFLFIPQGHEQTLAEMTPEAYEYWRAERHQHSYAPKFAGWFLHNKESSL